MKNIFASSDHHFFHKKIIMKEGLFQNPRPFETIEEHNETIIDNHNRIVGNDDKIIFGGDLILNTNDANIIEYLETTIGRMNGKKYLIIGNHDSKHKIKFYDKYFVGMMGYYENHGFIYSHIPIHSSQLDERFRYNIHGHVHSKTLPDDRYMNVSMEAINYTPKSFEEIGEIMKKRGII